MVLPAEIHRLLVFRRPLFEDGGYEVFSEDGRYQAGVSMPVVTGLEWTLTFKTSNGLTLVPMRVACLSFDLLDEQGRLTGSVKEARFSVPGKWVVEDETGITLGFLRFKHLINMSFSAPDGRELAWQGLIVIKAKVAARAQAGANALDASLLVGTHSVTALG